MPPAPQSRSGPPIAVHRPVATQGQRSNGTAVPFKEMVAYGMGCASMTIALNALGQLYSLFYVVGLGVAVTMIGYTQAFPRFFDAIFDPLMGSFSDNCRSRFGRRVPFLVAGGLLIGLSFWALWMVPRSWSHSAQFWWFAVASVVFYLVFSVYSVPCGALGFEMTTDYNEKTRLFAVAAFMNNAAAMALPWIPWLATRAVFNGDLVAGIRWVCLALGLLISALALATPVVCRERVFERVKRQAHIPIWTSIARAFRNRSFRTLVAAYLLLYVGFNLVNGISYFISIYYICGGDKQAATALMGWNGTLWALTGLAGVFPMAWLAQRYGKRATAIGAFLLLAGGNLTKIVCYSPTLRYLNLIPTALLSLGFVFVFSIVSSMVADICDEDDARTGERREGVYSSVYSWCWKMAVSVAAVANGYVIHLTGFVEGAMTESARVLLWMRVWEIGFPPLLCLAGAFVLKGYSLDEGRIDEVKEILRSRQRAAGGEA